MKRFLEQRLMLMLKALFSLTVFVLLSLAFYPACSPPTTETDAMERTTAEDKVEEQEMRGEDAPEETTEEDKEESQE